MVPVSVQSKLYSTTMMATLNSRMKLGIVSHSTSWKKDELSISTSLPSCRDTNSIQLNIGPCARPLQNAGALTIKQEVVITDDSKVRNDRGHWVSCTFDFYARIIGDLPRLPTALSIGKLPCNCYVSSDTWFISTADMTIPMNSLYQP